MTDQIPKQIHPTLREAIKSLSDEWQVVKKRDHYFLHHNGRRVACVGNNASKVSDYHVKKSLHALQRYTESMK